MHLIVPFAAPTSETARDRLQQLALPTLRRVLATLGRPAAENGDELSLTPPHERAWARAMGWGELPDGLVPTAAWLAQQKGLDKASTARGWAMLTPAHWRLGTEQVSLTDPAGLNLDEGESSAYLEAVRDLFESEGFSLHAVEPTTWLCRHEQLVDLPVASLDRVIGRNVDRWLGADARARLVRRLQNEVQMLLHEHPLNQAREARGLWPINSFWLSGCGTLPPEEQTASQTRARGREAVQVYSGLRSAALSEEPETWDRAFETFDTQAVNPWLAQVQASGLGSLTLCGERGSLCWTYARESSAARLLRVTKLVRPPDLTKLLLDL